MSRSHTVKAQEHLYSGVENLELMHEAVNYNAYLLDLVESAMPTTGQLLDFGAGDGLFARNLKARGRAPICVELDSRLRKSLLVDGLTAHADINALPKRSLDGAYTLNVLEHIDDDQAVLHNIASRLKAGAPLLIYVPAFLMLYSSMDVNVGHIRRYRMNELVGKMKLAGLAIERAEYVDSLGFLASLAFKWFGDKTGRVNKRALVTFDRLIFPVSRALDVITHPMFGKNLLVIGRRLS